MDYLMFTYFYLGTSSIISKLTGEGDAEEAAEVKKIIAISI